MAGIFVNYRTGDGGFAAALLAERLGSVFGQENVFLNDRTLPTGAAFRLALWDCLMRSTVLLAVIGPGWLTATGLDGRRRLDDPDDQVRWEIREAFTHARVVPVLLDDTALPDREQLPLDIMELAARHAIRLRVQDTHIDLDQLLSDLNDILPAIVLPKRLTRPARDMLMSNGIRLGRYVTTNSPVAGRDFNVNGYRP